MIFHPIKRSLSLLLLVGCPWGSWLSAQEEAAPALTRPELKTPGSQAPGSQAPEVQSPSSTLAPPPAAATKPGVIRAEPQLPPEAHPWGRFPLGSWKLVRVTSETLDPTGKATSTSVTETKTTLIEASDHDYALQVEVTVQVEGKRFARLPQVTRLSYWGDLSEAPAGVRKVGTAELELNGRRLPCEIRQVVTEQQGQRRQSVIHYCETTFPFVLKRESIVSPLGTDVKPQSTTVDVVASNLPHRVLGQLRPVAYVKTVQLLPTGSSLTMEIQSADVPGGVISHAAQELDDDQVAKRRSTLDLIDFGFGAEQVEEASPARKRWFRSRTRRGEEPVPSRR